MKLNTKSKKEDLAISLLAMQIQQKRKMNLDGKQNEVWMKCAKILGDGNQTIQMDIKHRINTYKKIIWKDLLHMHAAGFFLHIIVGYDKMYTNKKGNEERLCFIESKEFKKEVK